MQNTFSITYQGFPRQYWLMVVGMLINTIGASMIWPFMMIYASARLQLPLTQTALLLTINSAAGLLSSFIAGPIIDEFGRKWMMVGSLVANGIAYFFLSRADTFPVFALLMGISGAVNPLFRIGSDAMLADLIPEAKRIDAYAIFRMVHNLGIAMGPAIGGWIAAISYAPAFYGATAGMMTYSMLLALFATETLPQAKKEESTRQSLEEPKLWGGYPEILRDAPFMKFIGAFILVSLSTTMIWTLMGVYAKTNYQVLESQYGFIPATNALMVVTMQFGITFFSKRMPTHLALMIGALFYATAAGSVALMSNFWGFWLSMVVMTIGEMILVPTASTYVANHAPVDKRGRYMSIFGLTWNVAAGIAPVLGGVLNDNLGPKFIWMGGALAGYTSALAFLALHKRTPAPKIQEFHLRAD